MKTLFYVLVALVAGLGIASGLTAAIIASNRANCGRWSHNTGVSTKFVRTSWAFKYECYARTKNGLWVPNTQWKVLVNGG